MLSGRAILSSMTDRAFAAASLTAPPDQMVGVYIAENDIGVGQRGLGAAAVVAHRTRRRRARTLRPATTEDAPAAVSQRTLRWRGLDSNFPFRAQMGFGLRLPDVTEVPRAVASAAMPGHHDRIC